MVCGNVVADLEGAAAVNGLCKRCSLGERLDVGASEDSYGIHLSLGSRGNDHIVVDIEMSRHLELELAVDSSGVGEYACESGNCSSFGRNQINLSVSCAASALEVTVEGSEGYTLGVR